MSDELRHFLVVRCNGKLSEVQVYDTDREALEAYEQMEAGLPLTEAITGPSECVLLGADCLSTCIATHGNWFDEPSRLEALLGGANHQQALSGAPSEFDMAQKIATLYREDGIVWNPMGWEIRPGPRRAISIKAPSGMVLEMFPVETSDARRCRI